MPTTIQHGLMDMQLVNHICEGGNLSHLKRAIFYFQDVKLGFFFKRKFQLIMSILDDKFYYQTKTSISFFFFFFFLQDRILL